MNSGGNLQRTSARGFEPPFVEGKGAWGWLSPDTMRCVGAIDVVCAKQSFDGLRPTSGPPRYWRKKFESNKGRTRALGQLVETVSFSRQGINGNLPVGGAKRGLPRLVEMSIVKVEEAAKAFSSHSLRVRVTRDCLWPVRMAWGLPKHLFDRRRRRHLLGAEACRGQQCRSARVLLKLTS